MRRRIYHTRVICLLGAINLGFSSCCTEKKCLGWDELNEITLENFTSNELDSIALETFPAGSGFTNRIDSTLKQGHLTSGNFANVYLTQNFSKSHEYKITILSTGQVYTLTNFETKKEACNNCFPFHPSDDYYTDLESYLLNGQKQTGTIKLYK